MHSAALTNLSCGSHRIAFRIERRSVRAAFFTAESKPADYADAICGAANIKAAAERRENAEVNKRVMEVPIDVTLNNTMGGVGVNWEMLL